MSTKPIKLLSDKCRVCTAPAAYNYFGAISCESCRCYFRTIQIKVGLVEQDISLDEFSDMFPCDGDCPITPEDRKCKACRLRKCFEVGMSLAKSKRAQQTGIPSIEGAVILKTEKTPTTSATQKTPTTSATKKTPTSATKKTPTASATKKTPTASVIKKSRLSLKGSKKTPTTGGKSKGAIDGSKSGDSTKKLSLSKKVKVEDEKSVTVNTELEEDHKVPCVASLHNLGNTCFLNSVVQVLRYSPQFEEKIEVLAREIKATEHERKQLAQLNMLSEEDGDEEIQTWELVKRLHLVFLKMQVQEEKFMNGANFIAIRPYDLLDIVECLNPMFQGNQQQDAHEFLRCLLAYIQDAGRELNKWRRKSHAEAGSSCAAELEPVIPVLHQAPIEVEMRGGRKEEKAVVPKDKDVETRSSKRLSGGKVKDENVALENGISGKETVINGGKNQPWKSPPAKRGRGRKTLAEQNKENQFGIQKSILECLLKKNVVNGDKPHEGEAKIREVSCVNGEINECEDIEMEAVEGNECKNEDTKLSAKRKAHSSGESSPTKQETVHTQLEIQTNGIETHLNGDTSSAISSNDSQKSRRKRRKCGSPEGSPESVQKSEDVSPIKPSTKKTLGILGGMGPNTKRGRPFKPPMKITDESKSKVSEKSSTNHIEKSNDVNAAGDHNIEVSIKCEESNLSETEGQTLEEGQGDHKNSPPIDLKDLSGKADTAVAPKQTVFKEAFVKLDRNGITKYFEKVAKPARLEDVTRHFEIVVDPVEELFQGQVALQTRCCDCETITERREEYQDISVAVRRESDGGDDTDTETSDENNDNDMSGDGTGKDTAGDGEVEVIVLNSAELESPRKKDSGLSGEEETVSWIRSSLREVERLRDDNKYLCDHCSRLVEAERSMHYTSVPSVLTLHLKRFAMVQGLMGGFSKLTDHVSLPMTLPCIEDNCTQPRQHRLELYAVITHTGFTLSCGHYTAYVRAPSYHPDLIDQEVIKQTIPKSSTSPKKNKGSSPKLQGSSEAADPNNNADTNNNLGDSSENDSSSVLQGASTSSAPSDHDKNQVYWFECDDEVVTILREQDFLAKVAPGHSTTNTPYLLFYQRVENGGVHYS